MSHFESLIASYERSRRHRSVYHDLMRYRVREVLLFASLYDSFVLENDCVLTEQLYGEYFRLNLNSVPRITCCHSEAEALERSSQINFDLVVLLAGRDMQSPLNLARALRQAHPDVHINLLVTNNLCFKRLDKGARGMEAINRVFVWNGYSKLFLCMIRLLEDLRNVDADTATGLVSVILQVEDSVRYYSRYLPLLFKVVQQQTQKLIEGESGDEVDNLLRLRSRPKILFASSFEEAKALILRHERHLLTLITELDLTRSGLPDPRAGEDLLATVREHLPELPILIQSNKSDMEKIASRYHAACSFKKSESIEHELYVFLNDNLGFGNFVFKMPDGNCVGVAKKLDEFIRLLETVPVESILYHSERNHFSTWLLARDEISLAERLKPVKASDFDNAEKLRGYIVQAIEHSTREKSKGSIPQYSEDGSSCALCRFANGSVGGKGRGLVFIRSLLENFNFGKELRGLAVDLPRTGFIGIDEFERFLESNNLWSFAFYENKESENYATLRQRFLESPLSPELEESVWAFANASGKPLAVRSSGLFEDMFMVPFSGIYDTYLLPNNHPDPQVRKKQLIDAIKLIYASLFAPKSREYFDISGFSLEEERMAVIIQELVGTRHGEWFYPHISGTAQSFNYYPLSYLKPEDGLCNAAMGLGSYVVGGGKCFRFSPMFPHVDIMSHEEPGSGLQDHLRALVMSQDASDLGEGEGLTREIDLASAEKDPYFSLIASTFDVDNGRIVPGARIPGPRLIDFANIIKNEAIPFAQAISLVLEIASQSMGCPVEIEYAVNLEEPPTLYLLQLKPFIRAENRMPVDLGTIKPSDCLVYSEKSMGNGRDSVEDIVWVDPKLFDKSSTMAIAQEITELNAHLKRENRRYVLLGPGRWGSRDRWLGIPVLFTQISHARVIVETELEDFRVESSQGSHFFHNVTSMNIGYFSVPWGSGSSIDWQWLFGKTPAVRLAHSAWTHLDTPIEILMDGRMGKACVLKSMFENMGGQ